MDPNNYFMNCGIFLNSAAAAQQPNMFMGLPQQNVTAATANSNNSSSKSAPAKKGRASKKSNLNLSDAEKVKKRLDANRIAARESRKRKKVLVEELQRSVIFFSRANNQLKQKNEELERMLLQAQSQIISGNAGESSVGGGGEGESKVKTESEGGGPVKTEDDFGNPLILEPDVAAPNNNDEGGGTAAEEDQSSTDVTLDKGLIDENTKTDAATTSSQQPNPEIPTTLTPQQLTTTVLQHPIPLEWVPRTSGAPSQPPVGAPVAPMIDPNMYNMMMTPGNPMMLANPMMALQMFQQMNNTVVAGVPAAPNNQLPQGAAAAPTAAAVNPFPFMPPAMGNVIMPTPGGAFNPFLGATAAANSSGQQQQTTSAPNPAPAAAATTAPTDGAASSSAGGGEASEDKILRSL